MSKIASLGACYLPVGRCRPLRPCPLCGGHLVRWLDGRVSCVDCGAKCPPHRVTRKQDASSENYHSHKR